MIRHVGKRGGDIIAAVDDLLGALRMREYEAARAAAAAKAAEEESGEEGAGEKEAADS